MTLKLQLPEEIGSFWANQLKKVRILIVLELYKQKKISSGKAEELADLHTWNMLDILTKHDFPLDCTAKKVLRKIYEPLNRYPPNDCCQWERILEFPHLTRFLNRGSLTKDFLKEI